LITRYFAGALLPLVIIILFKTGYAPGNGLLKAQSAATLHQALDVQRYSVIGQFYLSMLFSEFPIIIPMIFTVFILNRRYFLSRESMILVTMQIGFLCVFSVHHKGSELGIEYGLRPSDTSNLSCPYLYDHLLCRDFNKILKFA